MKIRLYFLLCLLVIPSVLGAHEDELNSTVIHVDENGYRPVEIQIKPGTTVVFENIGVSEHWPATDNHPSHTNYDGTDLKEHCREESGPAFDSCRSISSGATWSFIFEKEGNFSYHDHLWPHLKGTIVVSADEPPTFLSKVLNIFITINQIVMNSFFPGLLPVSTAPDEKPKNILERYVALVEKTDPKWAIEALQEEAKASSSVMANCHEIMHEIGRTAYFQYGSFEGASVYQDSFCNSGYIHGVFEEYFTSEPSPNEGLGSLCDIYVKEKGRKFDEWQCHHGIGHGLMYQTGGDLDESLQLCEASISDEGSIEDCQNGVYMEIFNDELLVNELKLLDVADPMQICHERDTARDSCYHYLPVYFANTTELTYLEMFPACEAAVGVYRDSCKLGISTEAMKRTMHTPNEVFAMCTQIASLRDQTICVSGAVSMYINQAGSLEAGELLCQEIMEVYQPACKEILKLRKAEFANH